MGHCNCDHLASCLDHGIEGRRNGGSFLMITIIHEEVANTLKNKRVAMTTRNPRNFQSCPGGWPQ